MSKRSKAGNTSKRRRSNPRNKDWIALYKTKAAMINRALVLISYIFLVLALSRVSGDPEVVIGVIVLSAAGLGLALFPGIRRLVANNKVFGTQRIFVIGGVTTLLSFVWLLYTFQPKGISVSGSEAKDDEIGIVVAQFEQTGGATYEPDIDLIEVIETASATFEDVSVIHYGGVITDRENAEVIGDRYNATIVIYGRISPGGVSVNYEILPRARGVTLELEGPFRVSSAQVDNFESYLFDGMDSQYILGFTIGQLHFYAEHYAEAIEAFSLASNTMDTNRVNDLRGDILYFYLGTSRNLLGEYHTAISDFDQSIRFNPRYALAYHNRAVAFGRLGKLEAALEDYDRVLELDANVGSDEAANYTNRGYIYTELGRFEEALNDINYALEIDSSYMRGYLNRGYTHNHMGNYDSAIRDFEYVIANEPNIAPDAYVGLGVAYRALGEYELSLQNLNYAQQRDPSRPYIYTIRANVYRQIEDFERAINDYNYVIELNPINVTHMVDALVGRGVVYRRLGENAAAVASFTQAIELDIRRFDAYSNRATTYLSLGNYELALQDINFVLQQNPGKEYSDGHRVRGIIYIALEDYEAALADFNYALQMSPRNLDVYRLRGLLYLHIDGYRNCELAQADFKTYFEEVPDSSIRSTTLRDLNRLCHE